MNLSDSNKFGVIIIAYNPKLEEFLPKIKRYAKLGARVIVVNNGSDDIPAFSEIQIINLEHNVGIAKAQNIGVKRLKQLGISKLFLFDQDSVVDNDYFKIMLEAWNHVENEDNHIGMIGPAIYDRNMKEELPVLKLAEGRIDKLKFKSNGYQIVSNTLPISSGILTTTQVFDAVGGNDEDMFIDWVDFKFDLDVLDAGYTIYSIAEAELNHAIGETKVKKFLGKKISVSNYSPFREYYYFRNGIYFYRTTAQVFPQFKKYIRHELKLRLRSIPFEPQKWSRIKCILKGIIDGLKAKEVN